ncbi:MAG: ankyrin repeat domain-containing protein [Holosporales bacterium]|jgi:ankyrin repeat protein|nr:ankyrin repeat domain-containing protein [Holosporales bacterium]
MKRFYKTMALVSLLGISNFSYGTFHDAEVMGQDLAAPVLTEGAATQFFNLKDYKSAWNSISEPESKKKYAKDVFGETLLHKAASRGDIRGIKVLINAGADVNAENTYTRTPLCVAADYGRTEAIKVLLAAGASKEAKDNFGRTPRDLAPSEELKRLLA